MKVLVHAGGLESSSPGPLQQPEVAEVICFSSEHWEDAERQG